MVKDDNGEPVSGMFSYNSVLGMLLYLNGDNFQDVSLSVNIFSRYIFIPKLSHGLALKILEIYLKQTKDLGLVLNPNSYMCKVDSYPYANFSGMYGHEKPNGPSCVKIYTGFIIAF